MFTHQDRKLIASRVEQLKNKKAYKTIFKIIHEDKNNYISNEKGIFIDMASLSDITLEKIKIFLDDYDFNKPIIPIPKDFTSEESPKLFNNRYENSLLAKKVEQPKFENTLLWSAITSESKNDPNINSFNLSLDN